MRKVFKWTLFLFFWICFISSISLVSSVCLNIMTNSEYNQSLFVFSLVFCMASIVLVFISLSNDYIVTSPKLGMKILHDSGTFYADLNIEVYAKSNPRTAITIYQDKILWKKKIHNTSMSGEFSLEELVNEINKSIIAFQKENELKNKIKVSVKESLNLLSKEYKRSNKINSLFK